MFFITHFAQAQHLETKTQHVEDFKSLYTNIEYCMGQIIEQLQYNNHIKHQIQNTNNKLINCKSNYDKSVNLRDKQYIEKEIYYLIFDTIELLLLVDIYKSQLQDYIFQLHKLCSKLYDKMINANKTEFTTIKTLQQEQNFRMNELKSVIQNTTKQDKPQTIVQNTTKQEKPQTIVQNAIEQDKPQTIIQNTTKQDKPQSSINSNNQLSMQKSEYWKPQDALVADHVAHYDFTLHPVKISKFVAKQFSTKKKKITKLTNKSTKKKKITKPTNKSTKKKKITKPTNKNAPDN